MKDSNMAKLEFRPYRYLFKKFKSTDISFNCKKTKKDVPFLTVGSAPTISIYWVASKHSQSYKLEWPCGNSSPNHYKCKTEEHVITKIKELQGTL